MKSSFRALLFLFSLSLVACSQLPSSSLADSTSSSNHQPSQSTESSHHSSSSHLPYALGAITQQQLFDAYPTFSKAYQQYQVTPEDRSALQQLSQATELVIVFGSWCHDSQREVPRLLKLIDSANNTAIKTTLVAVGYNKQIPEAANPYRLAIQYTPTIFVIDQQGEELGRFIERPDTNWAADITAAINH